MTSREPQVPASALRDALEGLEEMLPYVDEYFREKWSLDDFAPRARAALAAAETGEPDGYWREQAELHMAAYAGVVVERDSARRERDEAMGKLAGSPAVPASPPAPNVAALRALCDESDRRWSNAGLLRTSEVRRLLGLDPDSPREEKQT